MNRRDFLKVLGGAMAAAYALPVLNAAEPLTVGLAPPESVEWHNLLRKTGFDITKATQSQMAVMLECGQSILQQKLDQGWRQVGASVTSYGYDREHMYSWLRMSHKLVRA